MDEEKSSYLTKEVIFGAEDLTTEVMNIPEWGGKVGVKTMTGQERDSYEESLLDKKNKLNLENSRAKLLAKCLVDEHGKLIFTVKDVSSLGKKSALVLDRLFDKARELNGIGAEAEEELEKNSESEE